MKVWIILGIVTIIFIVLCIICFMKHQDSEYYDSKYENMGIMFAFISVILIMASASVGALEEEYNEVLYDNIYSVRGINSDVNGSFFLGTGSVDEDTYYVVFVEDDKGLRMEKFNTEKTYIVEVEDSNYYVKKVKEKWESNEYYYIYVPKGTVIVEFKI